MNRCLEENNLIDYDHPDKYKDVREVVKNSYHDIKKISARLDSRARVLNSEN